MARRTQGRYSFRWWGTGAVVGLAFIAAVVMLAWSSVAVVQAQEAETATPTETTIPEATATVVVPQPTKVPPPVAETPAPEIPTRPPSIDETPRPDIVIAPPPVEPAPAPGAELEIVAAPTTGSGPASGGSSLAHMLTLALGLAGGVLLASGGVGLWVRRVR